MTREEEIRNAIDTIFPIPPSENGRKYEQALMATGFEGGVKWADEHPKSPWISIDEDLPCNHEKLVDNSEYPSTCICVVLDEHFVGTNRMYKTNGKWEWGVNFPNVLYWFPLPKLPKRIRQIYD